MPPKDMLPLLADWAAIFIEEHLAGALSDNDLRTLLRTPSPDARMREALRSAPEQAAKLITLALSWLHSLLPYVLSKVHRVAYGLLTGHELERATRNRGTPLSRKLLAVPFVGKDTPSASSEFSHPDVTIGFTIVAYRLNGMRQEDMLALLRVLLEEMRAESTMRYHQRTACRAYVAMVARAGGMVRGFAEDGRWLGDLKDSGGATCLTLLVQRGLSSKAAKNVWCSLTRRKTHEPNEAAVLVALDKKRATQYGLILGHMP